MSLISKSLWIFLALVVLLLLAGAFPTPFMITLAALGIGGLIIWQALLILKDDQPHEGEFPHL